MSGFKSFLPTNEEVAAQKKLDQERRAAEAEMAYRLANVLMPDDIRSRARVWGMEAFMEVLWNNAFQSGYREAMRNRSSQEGKDDV